METLEELKAELAAAEQELHTAVAPRVTSEDIEDISDAYQERLEFNWWVREQLELINGLKEEIALLS